VGEPLHQIVLAGMGAEASQGVDGGPDRDPLAEDGDSFFAIDEPPAQPSSVSPPYGLSACVVELRTAGPGEPRT
jgi:hypothetical protein